MIDSLFSTVTTTGADHPPTSWEAAERMRLRVGTGRFRVLALLALGDFTDDEISAALTMNPNTVRPRRLELVRAGYAQATEVRRRTMSGYRSIVWAISETGVRELRRLTSPSTLGAHR